MKKWSDTSAGAQSIGFPASYKESDIPRYRGNPLIEDLPDILTERKVLELFFNAERVTERDRSQEPEVRILMTESLRDFLVPASIHVVIARAIYQMVCNGYVNRNPFDPGRRRAGAAPAPPDMENVNSRNYPEIRNQKGSNSPITKMFIGVSGMGKTTCVDQILDYFPQVVRHSRYHGRPLTKTQITYLKVSCPTNASPEGFCLDILKAFDKALGEERLEYAFDNAPYGRERMKDTIEHLMDNYSVGILVIDDVNHLIKNSNDARELRELFTSLIDLWNIPVLFVGTPLAQELLNTNFTGIRRFNSEGLILWDRMARDSSDWQVFLDTLWKMQYTKKYTPLTPELSDALYEASQGITSLTISVFRLTQQQVILDEENEQEEITEEAIRKTQDSLFSAYKDLVEAIKHDDFSKLAEYEDLLLDIHNYDLSLHGEIQSINASRITELQKEIIEKEQNDLTTILLQELLNLEEMFPHLNKEDFKSVAERTIKSFSSDLGEPRLKREAFAAALELENKRELEVAEQERRQQERLALEQETRDRTNRNVYISLYHKALGEKRSVDSVFHENGLAGFGFEQ